MSKRKKQTGGIQSWDEADRLLGEMAACQLAINESELAYNIQKNELTEACKTRTKPLQDAISKMAEQLQDFVDDHRDEITGRSRALIFGKVGYRQSTSVIFPKGKKAKVLENLKKYDMTDCIRSVESVNKDILRTYLEKDIQKVGAVIKSEDRFYWETNFAKIMG